MLPPGEDFLFAFVGVFALHEFDHHRRAFQLEGLAKHIGQIALIGFRHGRHLVAVDHHARRVLAALVGKLEFDTAAVINRRRRGLHRQLHHLVQARRRQGLARREKRPVDGGK